MESKSMLLSSVGGLFGALNVKVFDKGNLSQNITMKNQITNQGRAAVLHHLWPWNNTTPINPLTYQFWSFAAGTNNTPPTASDTPASVFIAWRSRLVNVDDINVYTVEPNDYRIRVTKTVPLDAAIGMVLREAALFTRGDNDDPALATGVSLYARQIHPAIEKSATMTVVYSWQFGMIIQG